MISYLNILRYILDNGVRKSNRTGIDAISVSGYMFEHNLAEGFPLITTKKMGLKNIATELEFFIKGYTDKKWLQDRKCYIWDEWGNPVKVQKKVNDYVQNNGIEPTREQILKFQKDEMDLGPVYGAIWRDWNQNGQIDQLKNVVETLKSNPLDRRMIVSAWNPTFKNQQALPPCHYSFQLISDGITLDLLWNQRSVDTFLGLPYNIASYALLLILLAKEAGLKPGKLIGFLADVHIYVNHLEQIKLQLSRLPFELAKVEIPNENWKGILEWECTNFTLSNYNCHPKIVGEVAI